MEKYEIVSFIPAKGISRRIPRKNIKMLAGKPMIAWTIEASLESKYIDRTFVSTEDKEVKEIALEYGAEVIDRPAEFSQGEIPTDFAYYHFKYSLWKEKYKPDYVIFLFPTSPLRTEEHIDEAFELYFKSESPLLTSFTVSHTSPSGAYFINKSGKAEHTLRESALRDFHINKDQRPGTYRANPGAIAIGPYFGIDFQTFQYIGYDQPYIMKPEDSIDVDTEFDFKIAEMLLKERIKKED